MDRGVRELGLTPNTVPEPVQTFQARDYFVGRFKILVAELALSFR